MRSSLWTRATDLSPSELEEPTRELHHAAQLLASVAQEYVEAREDDSHRAFRWHPEMECMVEGRFTEGYGFRVALRPAELTLLILDSSLAPAATLSLSGRTREQAMEWLQDGLATSTGQRPALELPEFEIPGHPVARGRPFPQVGIRRGAP